MPRDLIYRPQLSVDISRANDATGTRAYGAAIQSFGENVRYGLRQATEDAAKQRSEEGKLAGTKSGTEGTYARKDPTTFYGDAYNEAAASAGRAKFNVSISKKAQELEAQFRFNPEGFRNSYDTFTKELIKGMPAEWQPQAGLDAEEFGSRSYNSILNSKLDNDRANNIDALNQELKVRQSQRRAYSLQGAFDSNGYKSSVARSNELVDNLQQLGAISPEMAQLQKDRFGSMDRVSYAASRIADDFAKSDRSKGAYARSQIKLKELIENPDWGLTDGEVSNLTGEYAAVIGNLRQERYAEEQDAKREQAENMAFNAGELVTRMNNVRAQLATGSAVSEVITKSDFEAAYPAKTANKMYANWLHDQAKLSAIGRTANSGPEELRTLLDQEKPDPTSPTFGDDQLYYQQLQSAAQKRINTIYEDPAGAAGAQDKTVNANFTAAASSWNPNNWGLAIQSSIGRQDAMGIELDRQRPLSNNVSDLVVSTIKSQTDGKKAAALLATVVNATPPQHREGLVQQLKKSGLPPGTEIGAELAEAGNSAAAGEWVTSSMVDRPDVTPAQRRDIDAAQQNNFANSTRAQYNQMLYGMLGDARVAEQHRREQDQTRRVIENRVTVGKQDARSAAQNAYQELDSTGVYVAEPGLAVYKAPVGTDKSLLLAGMRTARQSVADGYDVGQIEAGLRAADPDGKLFPNHADLAARIKQDIARVGVWAQDPEDPESLSLMIPVADPNGRETDWFALPGSRRTVHDLSAPQGTLTPSNPNVIFQVN